jgi:hypothetical protein
MRVAVLVVQAARDERDRRTQDGQHLRQRARIGTVVPDLEHLDAAQQAALQQKALDGRLRVAGQQRPECSALQQQHHRRVVDVVLRQGRSHVVRAGK